MTITTRPGDAQPRHDDVDHNALNQLYADFARAGMMPLWTQRDGLMPMSPQPAAVPALCGPPCIRWRSDPASLYRSAAGESGGR